MVMPVVTENTLRQNGEQDAHRYQTELVRASLLMCPKLAGDKSAPRRRGDL